MTKEYNDYLAHHGVKGQKWGIRRYQNEDGSLINPKGRNYSNNGPVKSEEEKRADAERRKAAAKKILGIAAGVGVLGLAAYLTTGRMKKHVVSRALEAQKIVQGHARSNIHKGLTRIGNGDYWGSSDIRAGGEFGKIAKQFGDVAKNTNRRTAVKIWLEEGKDRRIPVSQIMKRYGY